MKTLKITIIGLGLIGGSLGQALKDKLSSRVAVTGYDMSEYIVDVAIDRKAIDYGSTSLQEAVMQADFVFLCTPVLQMMPIIEQISPYLKPGAILSDVGSTKRFLVEKIVDMLPTGVEFVGGHPMAGSERSGITAAQPGLFQDKYYIIVPASNTSPAAVKSLVELIAVTGAIITVMDMTKHDLCAAFISHVPHVAAAALVNLLDNCSEAESLKLTGGGFRDTTRIASSNADMWADICLSNSEAINEGLKKLQVLLDEVIIAAEAKDRKKLHSFFSNAKHRRDSLISASP